MDLLNEFNRIMENTSFIALATSDDNIPNVRVMNFYYNSAEKGVIYLSTFRGSSKTHEFMHNDRVSLTTIPVGSNQHVRVTNASVRKSSLETPELIDTFDKKYPGIRETYNRGRDGILFYEVHFNEASVTLGVNQEGKIVI